MFSCFCALFFASIASSIAANEADQKSKEPLILTKHLGYYYYPEKAQIDKQQNVHLYYSGANDVTYFCPAEDDKQVEIQNRVIQSTNNEEYRYCLFKKKFQRKEKKQCKVQPRPTIVKIMNNENNHAACGRHNGFDESGKKFNGRLYKFTYEICRLGRNLNPFSKVINAFKKKKTSEIKGFKDVQQPCIYEFCFNDETKETVYVKHQLMYPALLKNLNLDRENTLDEISTNGYNIEELAKLDQVGQLYAQQLNNQLIPMTMQQLVPTEDLALYHWKITTFHQVNVKLQWTNLFHFWKSINLYIRKKLKKIYEESKEEFIIYTGTVDGIVEPARNENKTPRILYIGENISPPSIWWKLLYGKISKQAVLVVMHNIPNYRPTKRERVCVIDVCNIESWYSNTPKEFLGYAYCCAVNEEITILTDYHLDLKPQDINGVLEID